MKVCVKELIIAASIASMGGGLAMAQQPVDFLEPADEFRPWIFWDWMEDLVTTRGITSDLEHFHDFGLRGTLIMLIGSASGNYPFWEKSNFPHPVVSQTPEFFRMWKYAAEESARLGMTVTTQLGPGWCHSGGPAVKPDQAVQHLAYAEVLTTGPIDGAQFIFSDKAGKAKAYHSEINDTDVPQWVQVDLGKSVPIDSVKLFPFKNGNSIGFGFPTAFKIEVADKADFSDARVVYASPDGFKNPRYQTVECDLKDVTARYVRMTSTENYTVFRQGKTRYLLSLAEIEVMSAGNNLAEFLPAKVSSTIEDYGYTQAALTDSFVSRRLQEHGPFPLSQPGFGELTTGVAVLAYPDRPVIDLDDVVNLTDRVKDGKLQWDVPEGPWRVRWVVMHNAEAYNRPAPIGGLGLECDKLDTDAVDAMFEGMVGRYLKDSPDLVGSTIRCFEADSWEVGKPEWTWKFRREFINRRGYDPVPWLVSYKSDVKIGSKDLSARFENDMYQTLSDLFADNFFSHLTKKAKSLGMEFATEPYMGPFDPIRCGGRTTLPTGEFWASGDFMNSVRWAASAANTYGHPTVAAESFTGRWNDGNWSMDLFGIKRVGDLAFCNGVNHMILHGTAHQPWATDVKPGMPMMFWGTMFAPGQTWLKPGRSWTDYISRCQYMLSQGRSVADVAALMPNLHWEKALPAGLHKSYNYDHVSEETLLADMDWQDGYFVLPSGAHYRVLFLPKCHGKMAPAIIEKLTELVRKGGTVVCQDRPETAPGLSGYPESDAKVKELAAALWGDIDGKAIKEHRVGNGRMIWMKEIWEDTEDPETKYFHETRSTGRVFYGQPQSTTRWSKEFMALLGSITPPDVEVLNASGRAMAWGGRPKTANGMRKGEDAIAWTHRRDVAADTDIYFVSSQVADPTEAELLFRVKDRTPQLWFADTGKVYRPATSSADGDRTKVTIPLDGFGSVFVVFTPEDEGVETLPVWPEKEPGRSIAINGDWKVTFPDGYGAPESAELQAGSWTDNSEFGIKYFSGTATYTRALDLSADDIQSSVVLDLGNVQNFAEVSVNGQEVATLWKPPFTVEISGFVHTGKNELSVKITNTWWNRMIGDLQLPEDLKWGERVRYAGDDYRGYPLLEIPQWVWSGEQRPSKDRVTFSTWRFVEKDTPLRPAGLIGPVKLWVE